MNRKHNTTCVRKDYFSAFSFCRNIVRTATACAFVYLNITVHPVWYLLYGDIFLYIFYFYRSTFVGSAWSFVFFIPAATANDLRLRRIFYPRCYPLHLFSYLNSWERASMFLFECSVLNNDTTGTIFITSLVWRGPWMGIEPGTSHTRSQHYTTRLSRRRYYTVII